METAKIGFQTAVHKPMGDITDATSINYSINEYYSMVSTKHQQYILIRKNSDSGEGYKPNCIGLSIKLLLMLEF